MKSQFIQTSLTLCLLSLLFVSCVDQPDFSTPTPTSTVPATITSIPVLVSTFTPTLPAQTETATATVVPTDTSTPTIPPCNGLCPIVTPPEEITLCSTNSTQPAGVRVIARWLAQGKRGFYVAAQNSMPIQSIRFTGWNPQVDGKPIIFESSEDSGKCKYPATWNRWWDPDATDPAIGSKVMVEFLNSEGRAVVTISLTVAESELILDNFEYQP